MKNKRFKVDYDITVGNYCLHDDCKSKGVDGYIAYLSDEERANNLCDLLNELSEKKPFFKIVDDYTIGYDGDYFDLHRPSHIRSLIYIINRANGYSELQCEYNDLTMDSDVE